MSQTKKTPKVSVCVITYNHGKYIRQCLQSIVDQKTDFDFEVIVGDDSSTDDTTAIVLEFQNKYPNIFKVILHSPNVGGCNNYRLVHLAASAEYISHVDGDDYWQPNKLQAQIDFMEKNLFCSAVYTNANIVSESDEPLGVFSSGVKEFFDLSYLIKTNNFLTSSSTVYRSKLRELVIPASGEFLDYLIHINLAQQGQLGFIDQNLVSYRHRSATSIILADNSKVRLLVWDALSVIKLPKVTKQYLENSKLIFIAESIIYELRYARVQGALKWITLISKDSKPVIIWVIPKLTYFIIRFVCKKITNRIYSVLDSSQSSHVYFKK